MESVAHEAHARGVRQRIIVAALRRFVDGVDGHHELSVLAAWSKAECGVHAVRSFPDFASLHPGYKRYPPSVPLVDGTSPAARGSIATAVRSARASPLKHDSEIWWSLVPYNVSTCSVTPAFIANAWNHSCTSSVSNAPTLSRENSALNTRNGRPEISIAMRVSASSMGMCTLA